MIVGPVVVHGLLGQVEHLRDLSVRVPDGGQEEHLLLALGQVGRRHPRGAPGLRSTYVFTILVTIAGTRTSGRGCTERTALTTSFGSAPRVRKPSAPALSASVNCSLPQRHSIARISPPGFAARMLLEAL